MISDITESGFWLKQGIDKWSYCISSRNNNQEAKKQKDDDQWDEPEFFSGFQKIK
jgi:hypothetical protein